jgi:hypothetical protein
MRLGIALMILGLFLIGFGAALPDVPLGRPTITPPPRDTAATSSWTPAMQLVRVPPMATPVAFVPIGYPDRFLWLYEYMPCQSILRDHHCPVKVNPEHQN